MRRTLLELTQEILSSLDSDEVNSISDTVESYQVAVLLRGVYYDLATDLGLLEHDTTLGLEASGDATKPVTMTVPSNCTRIDWIKYNNCPADEDTANYLNVEFLAFDKFIEMTQGLRNDDDVDVSTYTFEGDNGDTFEFHYRTDKFPSWYTSYNNRTILLDSLDVTVDTTLQRSKTMCYGAVYPTFTLVDEFEPDLDPTQFSLFLNRAKVRAFAELKQVQNAEAAGEARRQKIIVQKRNHELVPHGTAFDRRPKYGRK